MNLREKRREECRCFQSEVLFPARASVVLGVKAGGAINHRNSGDGGSPPIHSDRSLGAHVGSDMGFSCYSHQGMVQGFREAALSDQVSYSIVSYSADQVSYSIVSYSADQVS
ncbi:hypothetical protein ACOMHN_036375 [Nucella lapillus]